MTYEEQVELLARSIMTRTGVTIEDARVAAIDLIGHAFDDRSIESGSSRRDKQASPTPPTATTASASSHYPGESTRSKSSRSTADGAR